METPEEDIKWIRAEFTSASGTQIEFIHNILDKDTMIGVFESWLKHAKPEDIDAKHFCHYINTLRTAGIAEWYAVPYDFYIEMKEEAEKRAKEKEDEQ